jgi:hypothetical protein
MESSAKTRLPLHSNGIIYPLSSLRTTLHFGIIFTHIYLYHWGRKEIGLSKTPFFAINAKGGESFKPKAKGPHHHLIFKLCFLKKIIGIFQTGMCYFQLVSIKTLLKTKRRISI